MKVPAIREAAWISFLLVQVAFHVRIERIKHERGEKHTVHVPDRLEQTGHYLNYMPKHTEHKKTGDHGRQN